MLGGSYGIGADVARLAEQAGCRVFAFSRSTTGTHVEDPAAVAGRARRQVHAETGRIDAVVLTAALLHKGPLSEHGRRAGRCGRCRSTTSRRCTSPAPPSRTCAETRGHLVLFTSSSYTRGRADYVLYSSTKAAVVNLTQALADEWSGRRHPRSTSSTPSAPARRCASQAFGEEPEGTLLSSEAVASTTLDVLRPG